VTAVSLNEGSSCLESSYNFKFIFPSDNTKRMRSARRVLQSREVKNAYKILAGKFEKKYHLGDKGVERNVILKWILKKYLCEDLD
jgi:hypothetical protein